MAQLVAGFGSSESPQLHVPPEMWPTMGELDKNSVLLAPDAKVHTYDELVQMAGPHVAQAITPEEHLARHTQCQENLAKVGARMIAANLDALVVFSSLETRIFGEENTPGMFVYSGATVPFIPAVVPDSATVVAKAAAWGWGLEPLTLAGAPELGDHIIENLTAKKFSFQHAKSLPEGKSIGAYFGFTNRLLGGKKVPLVPVVFSTGNSTRSPALRTMFDVGATIGEAIKSWPRTARVGVFAIGGLSHTVIDEEMDRRMLQGLVDNSPEALCNLPEPRYAHGNSQSRNWLAAGGVCQDLTGHLIDYIPCYRSPGGTGCGMAFMYWD